MPLRSPVPKVRDASLGAPRRLRRLIPLLTALALASPSAATKAQEPGVPPGDAATVIRSHEEQLSQAMFSKDRMRLEALLAPDYVLRSVPDIGRETWITNAVSLCWGDRSDIDGFSARQLGEVVVASFELTFYVDPGTCQPAVLRSLITDVWVQQAGVWRLQVRHSGPAPAAGAGVAAQFGAVPLPPPVWDIDGELSLVATGGNTSTRTVGLGGTVLHRGSRTNTRGAVAFVTSEAESVTQARSLTAQARHGLRLTERLEVFGQGLYTRDRFAGIDHRGVADGGLAYTTRLPLPHSLIVEGGLGYTVEQRLDRSELRFVTSTGTVRYRWRLRPGTDLTEDVALIGDIEDAPNWRGTSTTALTVALNQLLSLRASHIVEHRNTPVAGFGRTDTRTAAALVFSFEGRR